MHEVSDSPEQIPLAQRRFRLRHLLVPALGTAAIAYFGYHAVHGDHGLLRWQHLQAEAAGLALDVESLVSERRRLEHDVALLRPESLDPDLLDERARAALGYAGPNEITIFRDRR